MKRVTAEWLKSLGRKDRVEAQEGVVAGRKWGENRPHDVVKTVIEFAAFAFTEPKDQADGFWDEDHDAAFDHYAGRMWEAVGYPDGDDEDFADAMEAAWGDPFQVGWYFGVGEVYAEMLKAAA